MYCVYVLYCPSLDRFCTGMSKFTAKRERQHRKGQTQWTSQADDWQQVWVADAHDSAEARALEKKIKARGARRYLQDRGVGVPPGRDQLVPPKAGKRAPKLVGRLSSAE
jgi:putative endonuclease